MKTIHIILIFSGFLIGYYVLGPLIFG